MTQPFCIAVPARNEAESLPALIAALAQQDVDAPIPVALLINNSSDDSIEAALCEAGKHSEQIQLKVEQIEFPPELAHAGSARRAAMDLASTLISETSGLILSTDADCRPPETWITANLKHAGDYMIVGGRIELDDKEEGVPPTIRSLRRRFDRYWSAVRAIEDEIDPCEWDLPPRHGDHTGASLCMSVELYHKAGGVPLLATGEDRALVAAAVAAGGQLIHPLDVWTRASARQIGRAEGGMANDMALWADSTQTSPPKVPSFEDWRDRAHWRREMRMQVGDREMTEREKLLPPMVCTMALPMETHP